MNEKITLAEYLNISKPKNKYFAEKTERDGIWFESKLEADRYSELKILERVGTIKDLKLQPEFPLIVENVLICTYRADFTYFDFRSQAPVVEDAKSPPTRKKRDYRIKKKLVEAIYKIKIVEI